jgi:hypothetical protein
LLFISSGKLKFFTFCTAFAILANISVLFAQELEPRAFVNVPVGLNFAVAGYTYSHGGVLFDPAVPLDNANIQIHGSVFAYARSVKVGKMSGKFDAIVPYAWLSGTADYIGQPMSRAVNGLGDPRIRMSVNFLGAPALHLAGFRDYKQNFVFGGSIQVYLPLGQYDPDKLVNIGTNRFSFKPELGVSKNWGQLITELTAGVTLFTINHDFFGGKTRSQAPIGSIQGHINYNFKKGAWMSLDGTYYWGGHTTTDGVKGNDLQKNTRIGYTLSLPLNLHNSLKFMISTGVSTRTGSDFNQYGVLWQYKWGKGMPKKKI